MSPRGRLTQSGSEQREAVAAEVMARVVEEGLGAPLPAGARVLVVDDLDGHLERDLAALGHRVVRWCRLTVGDRPGAPWPGAGPFDACCLPLDICLGLTSINADDAGDQPRAEVPPSRG